MIGIREHRNVLGAFFAESCRGKPVKQHSKIMGAMSRTFEAMGIKGNDLEPDWFRKAGNREQFAAHLPSGAVSQDLLRGFDVMAGATALKIDEKDWLITIDDAPGVTA